MSLWCELCGWSPADDTEEELFHVRHVYRGGQLCPECGMGRLERYREQRGWAA